ncbi:MAG: SH3 domain-containing protein [Robiginitomaculum sp.]
MRAKSFLYFPLISALLISVGSFAQDMPTEKAPRKKSSIARIVEDVPGPNEAITSDLIRVNATKTPSGFRVPRYVSLKYGVSNGRTGPSRKHPIVWRYTRKGMPMIVVAETEVWRKVRDINGDESWMNRRLLDGTRMVLARSNIILHAKPGSASKKRAAVSKGGLLTLSECTKTGWCKVKSEDGRLSGYALKNLLWGAERL